MVYPSEGISSKRLPKRLSAHIRRNSQDSSELDRQKLCCFGVARARCSCLPALPRQSEGACRQVRKRRLPDLQEIVFGPHMIEWKAVKPDSTAADLARALARLSFVDAIAVSAALQKGPLVIFEPAAKSAIRNHVSARREESGGLLLGQAFVPCNLTAAIQFPVVVISKAIPSLEYHGTSVSLHMGPSVWESVRTEAKLLVVGWFHSHPNLGAFFSGTDRKTQRDFFHHEYSVGYVIDPVRDEHAYFVGKESLQVPEKQVLDVSLHAALEAMSRVS